MLKLFDLGPYTTQNKMRSFTSGISTSAPIAESHEARLNKRFDEYGTALRIQHSAQTTQERSVAAGLYKALLAETEPKVVDDPEASDVLRKEQAPFLPLRIASFKNLGSILEADGDLEGTGQLLFALCVGSALLSYSSLRVGTSSRT